MNKPLDPTTDWLADAALTPDQRHVWSLLRTELIDARQQVQNLEKRVKTLESEAPPSDDEHTILTRPEFNREVARMLAFDERYGGTSSVLYFDFENLDTLTSQHGKSVVNAALREISNVLMKCVRNSDIVGRLAADEFGILLGRCDNTAAWKKGEQVAGLLYEALSEIHGTKLAISISYGAYTFQGSEDVATGLKQAAQMVTRAVKE